MINSVMKDLVIHVLSKLLRGAIVEKMNILHLVEAGGKSVAKFVELPLIVESMSVIEDVMKANVLLVLEILRD